MITKLTSEQEATFPHYVDKWRKIHTDTRRLEEHPGLESVEKIVNDWRVHILKRDKAPVVIADNPLEGCIASNLSEQGVSNEDLITETKKFLVEGGDYEIDYVGLPYQTGSWFSSLFSFYDFFMNETDIDFKAKDENILDLYKIWEATKDLGCIYPMDNVTIVTQKPTKLHFIEGNVLHNDVGAAVEYAGIGSDVGINSIYALNGIKVPEYLAVTPAQDLDPEFLTNPEKFAKVIDTPAYTYSEESIVRSADVKAEFIRKIGMERLLEFGKSIDTYENYDPDCCEWWWKSEYELFDMESIFDSIDYAPHLKMLNQTTGIWHMEAVSPNCSNIKDALKERFNGNDFIIESID